MTLVTKVSPVDNPPPHSVEASRSVGVDASRPERAELLGAAPRRAGPRPGDKEIDVVFAELLFVVPAALAGVGGVLLGDRVGLWLKTALAGREED